MSATSGCGADRPTELAQRQRPDVADLEDQPRAEQRAQREATGAGNSDGDETRIASGAVAAGPSGRPSSCRANAAIFRTRPRLIARSCSVEPRPSST